MVQVDWEDDGKAIRNHLSARPQNADKYFRQGIAYNNIAKQFSARHVDSGFIFDQKNSMFFADSSFIIFRLEIMKDSFDIGSNCRFSRWSFSQEVSFIRMVVISNSGSARESRSMGISQEKTAF